MYLPFFEPKDAIENLIFRRASGRLCELAQLPEEAAGESYA